MALPDDSNWFEGHFPDDPILPGVAQIQLALERINAALGRDCRIKKLRRIRFRTMIRPGQRFEVATRPDAGRADTFQFRITRGDAVACTGTIVIETVNTV